MYKHKFLQRHNPEFDKKYALTQAIKASLQHNPTYSPTITGKVKIQFHEIWNEKLILIGNSFEQPQNLHFYLESVFNLQMEINCHFSHILCPNKMGYENGFRISHSQKSIAIYLKHLWCMDIIPEPPCCPIDRIISNKARVKLPVNWTKMNDIVQVHETLIKFHNIANAYSLSLAVWECQLFSE